MLTIMLIGIFCCTCQRGAVLGGDGALFPRFVSRFW
jgi:hypothetical protein